MNKKNYITPNTLIHQLEIEQMIAQSIGYDGNAEQNIEVDVREQEMFGYEW